MGMLVLANSRQHSTCFAGAVASFTFVQHYCRDPRFLAMTDGHKLASKQPLLAANVYMMTVLGCY
jgi:hypothetical protein